MHSWSLRPGAEVLPGRTAVRLLGGGNRYEAYLAWDDSRLALVVAKVVRPDQVGDPYALVALRREADRPPSGICHTSDIPRGDRIWAHPH